MIFILFKPINGICLCQVIGMNGEEVGKISKQWSGFVKEYFTQADNFGVSCEYRSS